MHRAMLHAEKRGGAWMDEVVGQSRLLAPAGESVRLPVGHMVCNQTPPVGDKPSLMTFRVRERSQQCDWLPNNLSQAACMRLHFSVIATMPRPSIRPAHGCCRRAIVIRE